MKHLKFFSLESPYNGIRLTGNDVIIDTRIIHLPYYMNTLIHEEGINIQITPIKCNKVIWIESINLQENYFIVGITPDNMEYEFYWSFTGVRKDVEKLIVES